MKRIYVIIILFYFSFSLIAQEHFVNGFYVLNNGDTVQCSIKYEPGFILSKVLTVKLTDKKTEAELFPEEIRSFCLKNKKCYESMASPDDTNTNRKLNFQCIVKGYYSFYLLHEKKKTRFFIKNESDELIELKETIEVVNGWKKSKHEYISVLKELMIDDISVYSQVDNTVLSVNSLSELIKEYDKRKDETTLRVCKNKEYTFVDESVFLGAGFDPFSSNIGFRGGVIARFSQPETSNRFFINLGVFYNNIAFYDDFNNYIIEFQLSFSFKLSNKTYIPYLFGGVNPKIWSSYKYNSEERYYYFYPYSFIIGIKDDFFITEKIQLVGELSLTNSVNLMIGVRF